MNHLERLEFLIQYLLNENPKYSDVKIPVEEIDKKRLYRSLVNIRPPECITNQYLQEEALYLKEEMSRKTITDINELFPIKESIYLWQGDISTLRVDAIVNAANSQLLGCFIPEHHCIDNVIHSAAGVALRLECKEIMNKQNHPEKTGLAKITKAYALPSKYVIHTVGPIITKTVTEKDRNLLASSYRNSLTLADKYGLESIAFCCISTGLFRFPKEEAAKIAITTVYNYLQKTNSSIKVLFNVFTEEDYEIYKRLLSSDSES